MKIRRHSVENYQRSIPPSCSTDETIRDTNRSIRRNGGELEKIEKKSIFKI